MSAFRKTALVAVAFVAGALGTAQPARAQINSEVFARVGFNFSPPGARSAALGGAFVSVADDATAAETNPAGLTILLHPQAGLEFKNVNYGVHLVPEAGGGPDGRDFSQRKTFPSFASLVLPAKGLTLAAVYDELVNYRSSVAASGSMLSDGSHLYPFTALLDMRVDNMGGSLAFKLGSALSVGVTAGASRLNMDVDHRRYALSESSPGYTVNHITVTGDQGKGTSRFINAGAMLRAGAFSLGAVAKLRPEFTGLRVDYRNFAGDLFGTYNGRSPDTTFSVKVPDAFAAGASVRATERLTLSVSAERIKYSQIPAKQAIVVSYTDTTANAQAYEADDGTDLHAGMEYVALFGRTPVALRVGGSRLAASNTYYAGPRSGAQALWGTAPADPQFQVSGGFGTVLSSRLQLDVAAVGGGGRSEAVASLVVLF